MKILFITQLLPYPVNTGGKLKTYRILKILSKYHEVHLLSLVDKRDDLVGETELRTMCKTVKTFVSPIITKQHKRLILKIFLSCFTITPFIVYKFFSRALNCYIKLLLNKTSIDLIYVDHITMAQYIPTSYKGKLVYDEHNVSNLAYLSYVNAERNYIKKLFFFLESKKLELFERKWIPRFDYIFVISRLDGSRLIKLGANPQKISFLPIPFRQSYNYHLNRNSFPTISFVAMLSWRPNEKGILWFIDEVFPLIKKRLINIKLIIVGQNGDRIESYIRKLKEKNIEYIGYIKNLTSIYGRTSVFIVPILIGGGIRIKLLDAMTHGIPIVSTTLGAEGIDVGDGKELLIRDHPKDFAKAVIKIIIDKNLAKRLSQNAYKFIKKHYNEEETKKVLNIINQI